MQALTLSELSKKIELCINENFKNKTYWVVAEISSLQVRGGHCYLTLVEKKPSAAYPLCEMKAIIWANYLEDINKTFFNATQTHLRAEIEVMFLVEVNYSVRYGLSLYVYDVKPEYTLGQLAIDRSKTIELLKQQNLYQLNKKLPLPQVIQRIALLSATDSKGFEDFVTVLKRNEYGYKFTIHLYPVMLQGNRAADEIAQTIYSIDETSYDVIAIIRGGGGALELHCFNSFNLAKAISLSKLPVLTGIGHTTDFTVADEMACLSLQTPTAAANYILKHNLQFEQNIQNYLQQIFILASQNLKEEINQFELIKQKIYTCAKNVINKEVQNNVNLYNDLKMLSIKNVDVEKLKMYRALQRLHQTKTVVNKTEQVLNLYHHKIKTLVGLKIKEEKMKLDLIEKQVNFNNPRNILSKGYSICRKQGKVVKNAEQLQTNDTVEIELYSGKVISEVKQINNQ